MLRLTNFMHAWLCITFLLSAKVSGLLQVLEPPEYAGLAWETVHFAYYGQETSSYSGVVISFNDSNSCSKKGFPQPDKLAWLEESWFEANAPHESQAIVLNPLPHCEPFTAYEAFLRTTNIQAFVEIGTATQGSYPEYGPLEHPTWSSCRHCNKRMGLYAAPDPYGSLSALVLAQGSKLRVFVGPPHNSIMVDEYRSFRWTLLVRVLCPLIALMTSISAILQLREARRKGSENTWSVRNIFCAIELAQSVIVGVLFCLGQGGPQLLPCYIHGGFVLLLRGFTTSGVIILACFLFEEKRHVRTGRPRRPIFEAHRLKLSAVLVCFIGLDFLVAIFSFSGYYGHATYNNAIVVLMAIELPVETAALIFYLVHVKRLIFVLENSSLVSSCPPDVLGRLVSFASPYTSTSRRVGPNASETSLPGTCQYASGEAF